MYGAWRASRPVGRVAPYVLGPGYGASLAFFTEVSALRESGDLTAAVTLAKERVADARAPTWSRNVAIDVLISGGAYEAALGAEPSTRMPKGANEALGLVLIQINLAEAEYNLGRWADAERRLHRLELAAWPFPITRAGLTQQRAWIAAHHGRAEEAMGLCESMKPRWLPPNYRAEYHFTRTVAFLAAGRLQDAASALGKGERAAIRLSSKRNALFLRARLAAEQRDWLASERLGREASQHRFRGQGGMGLLLWAETLIQLGREREAAEALDLVVQRDPESEAAQIARLKVADRPTSA
jgi:hypothetical protein